MNKLIALAEKFEKKSQHLNVKRPDTNEVISKLNQLISLIDGSYVEKSSETSMAKPMKLQEAIGYLKELQSSSLTDEELIEISRRINNTISGIKEATPETISYL